MNHAFQNVNFVKGSGQDLDVFPGEYFDFVFSYLTFQHLPRKEIVLDYLSEIYRVLKKGGLFKVLLRKQWSGVAFAFGFVPIPRLFYPYIPEIIWTIYQHLALSEEERLYRSKTYRGSGISGNEAKQALLRLQFEQIEIQEHASKFTYWCCGRKPEALPPL